MCSGLIASCFLCLGFVDLLDLWVYSFYQIWKHFSHFFIILSTLPRPTPCLSGPQLHIYSATWSCPMSQRESFLQEFSVSSLSFYLLLYSHLRREVYFHLCQGYTFSWTPEPIHPHLLDLSSNSNHTSNLSPHCFPGLKTKPNKANKTKHKNNKIKPLLILPSHQAVILSLLFTAKLL